MVSGRRWSADPWFRRHVSGVRVRIPRVAGELLERLPDLLDGVGRDSADPAAVRLRPPFYADDAAAEDDVRPLADDDLDEGRRRDRDIFRTILAGGPAVVTRTEAEAFLRVLVEGRLVLAARSGIVAEESYEALDARTRSLLDLLAVLQVELVEVLEP